MKNLELYRDTALTYLESRVLAFNDDVDYKLDTALRAVSKLPIKPVEADNYNAILGMKPVLEQRRLCIKLLKERLVSNEISKPDLYIDEAIRVLNKLPDRPSGNNPYVALFTLDDDLDEVIDTHSLKTSKKGIELIHSFESYRECTYKDPGSIDGKPISGGFGSTRLNGQPLKLGQCFPKEVWEQQFEKDLKVFEDAVKNLVKVPLNQNQFDSAVSFTYNIGIAGLTGSTFLKRLNKKQYNSAAEALLMWNKGANGKVLPGLVRRRKAECNLFLAK